MEMVSGKAESQTVPIVLLQVKCLYLHMQIDFPCALEHIGPKLVRCLFFGPT